MTASVLIDLNVRTDALAVSDMKTLFASVWCFSHGQNAYSVANVQSVFAANRVIFPGSWFSHAPVYPPTTLAFLLPLTVLGMVPAMYVVIGLSSVLFALALAVLMRQAAQGASPLVGQIAIAICCGCCPLFSFALSMANVSIAASALCIIAFLRRRDGSSWLYGALLASAVLLKPHLAIWMLTGLFLMPEQSARKVGVRAAILSGGFAALTAIALLRAGNLGVQLRGFSAILRSETASGSSMNPGNHEIIPIVAQITSLHSLAGFWFDGSWIQSLLILAVLVALGVFIARLLRNAHIESEFVPALGAWIAFGLLATYHRAHDALVLLMLVPWLVDALRRRARRWYPWAIILLYAALNVSVSFDLVRLRIADGEYNPLIRFLLLRQAALADLALVLVLLIGVSNTPRFRTYFRVAEEVSPTQHVLSAS